MAKTKATTPPPVDPETIEDEFGLVPKQEAFCRYYTQGVGELFGNATLSYAAAYGYQLEALSQVDEYGEDEEDVEESLELQPHGGALKRRKNYRSPYDRAKNVCAVEAHRLLSNPNVQARCRTLLNALLQDEVVDSERAKVIMQDGDLGSKLRAIVSYDKLKGRIIDRTQQINRLPFGDNDLSVVIATLPQERQDYFYEIIRSLIDEAELLRSTGAVEGGVTR